ncbi:glycosyltransferase family 2 protein [Agromyces kandeliae]|uniref:Glycosyltransferase n=1 Tax=Agromyces kandeliae TaxID=2666141 RepID=A0A6L5R6F7_9MICO|nr:glycosyltransferase family A protein [Agromyces kandeliae]MRX45500.1 glycosyltransferase [Agromyces kandeliae]
MTSDVTRPVQRNAAAAPLVTVVIPLHDRGRYIAETLESVLRQEFDRFEVVVVDDASTDDGPDVVRRFLADPRVTLMRRSHGGVGAARNAGAALAAASSEYLIFMDDDDVSEPDLLGSLVAALDAHPDASGAFARGEFIDADGGPVHDGAFRSQMIAREELGLADGASSGDYRGIDQVFLATPVVPMGSLLMRRSAFEATGGYDPTFVVGQDWDFTIRLARRAPLVVVDRPLVRYRRHGGNASANRVRDVRTARRVWATAYFAPENTAADSALLASVWRTHQRRTSARKVARGRALLRSGRVVDGLARLVDGLLHRALRRPLKAWLRPVAGSGGTGTQRTIAVERGQVVAPH